MSKPWPDSDTFWRDKRVIVTGGSGFLGLASAGELLLTARGSVAGTTSPPKVRPKL